MLSKKKLQQSKEYEKLMRYALNLISKRRLTCHEMRLRLEKRNVGSEDDRVKVIKRLMELDYLNDSAYANDFIQDRLKFRPRGVFVLRRELYKKGIEKEIIENAVQESVIDEEEIAKTLAMQKLPQLERYIKAKRKQKLTFFLQSKGIQSQTIYKVVDEVTK